MSWMNVKHIKRVVAKGRVYFYHGVTGHRLPDDENARLERVVEINKTLDHKPNTAKTGTVAHMVSSYLASADFKQLRPASRKTYKHFMEIIRRTWGPLSIVGVRRKNIINLRDKFSGKPATANYLVTAANILFKYAIEREWRPDNPAAGIKPLRTGEGHRSWTPSEITKFLATAGPPMTLALKLGLHTGQRLSDVLAMSWADIDGTAIRVVQGKTGVRLWVPLHRDLRSALADVRRTCPVILTDERGKPMTAGVFNHRWRAAILEAGMDGHTFHGLRYTAAGKLAEAGCDVNQIASITGHRSLEMLQKYTRGASQKRLAETAIAKLERNET